MNPIKRKYSKLRKIHQWLCGINGHIPSNDWGYGGGEYADCWCARCDKMFSVPKTHVYFRNKESYKIMKLFDKSQV